jgi:hypothetical protein
MAQTKRRHPRTGEKRQANVPLKIDRLPVEVRDAIQYLKNVRGKTWQEIEEISALPYSEKWAHGKGGFVNWEQLATPVLELFPDMRLPHSNLHRWYDLRVAQVTAETMARAEQARVIAEGFVKSVVAHDDKGVLNAARDQLMSILAEDATPKGRKAAAAGLIALAEMMQRARENTIKERKVAVDERRIAALEAREKLARQKLEAETEKLRKKAEKGQITPDDLARLTERTFGFRVKPEADAHAA